MEDDRVSAFERLKSDVLDAKLSRETFLAKAADLNAASAAYQWLKEREFDRLSPLVPPVDGDDERRSLADERRSDMRPFIFKPTPEQYAWTFGGNAAVATLVPGQIAHLWSEDAFAPKDSLGARFAEPLARHSILKSANRPVLRRRRQSRRYALDRANATVLFQALDSYFSVDIPLEPMLGTVGVAPKASRFAMRWFQTHSAAAWIRPSSRAGTTLYLGVNVAAARFSLGDGHYACENRRR